MERGTVKTFDKLCGLGTISHGSEGDVKFYAESVVGGSRAGLTQGDQVWFEMENIKNLHIAINVRKCM